jgi:hypothetical protein
MKMIFVAVALSLLSALPQAHAGTIADCSTVAGNVVANCGFETGDFTGWTAGNGYSIGTPGVTGSYDAYTGNAAGDTSDTLSQSIATAPGADYTIIFDLFQDHVANTAVVSFGGTQIADLVNVADNTWDVYTYTAAAVSSSTTLSFALGNNPYYAYLDNVSVTEQSATTPEPAVWTLLAGGLALAALLRRTRLWPLTR